jgi:hypothetical protein
MLAQETFGQIYMCSIYTSVERTAIISLRTHNHCFIVLVVLVK